MKKQSEIDARVKASFAPHINHQPVEEAHVASDIFLDGMGVIATISIATSLIPVAPMVGAIASVGAFWGFKWFASVIHKLEDIRVIRVSFNTLIDVTNKRDDAIEPMAKMELPELAKYVNKNKKNIEKLTEKQKKLGMKLEMLSSVPAYKVAWDSLTPEEKTNITAVITSAKMGKLTGKGKEFGNLVKRLNKMREMK